DFNIPMIWLSVNLDLFIVDSPPKLLYWKILLLSTFIFREDYHRAKNSNRMRNNILTSLTKFYFD
ncbi:MAG: hypothetical protein ABGX83_07245, partial [Nitrospira sp.]